MRNFNAIQHIGKGDHLAIGHICVPVLTGVAESDWLAVDFFVGQDHHLGMTGLLIHIGNVDL